MATETLGPTPAYLAHERRPSPGHVRLTHFFRASTTQSDYSFSGFDSDKRIQATQAIRDLITQSLNSFPSADGRKEELLAEATTYLHGNLPQDLQSLFSLDEMLALLPKPAPDLANIVEKRNGKLAPDPELLRVYKPDVVMTDRPKTYLEMTEDMVETGVIDPKLLTRPIFGVINEKFFAEAESKGFETRRFFLKQEARRFLVNAFADGAFWRSRRADFPGDRWELAMKVLAYYGFTNASFADIGKILGYTNDSMPARIYGQLTRSLFTFSSRGIRRTVDFDSIDFKKTEFKKKPVIRSEAYKDKLSLKKGGARRQIRLLVAKKITDPDTLSKLTGVPLAQVELLVRRLRRQGVKGLEKSKVMRNRDLEAAIVAAKSRRDLKKALVKEGVNFSFVRTRGELFYSLQGLLRSYQARFSSRELDIVYNRLIDAGFCALKFGVNYYFPKHKEETKAAITYLKRHCELFFLDDRNKFFQFAGPQIEKPEHMEIRRNGVSVLEELRQLGVLSGDALLHCPYPVFVYSQRGLVVGKEYYEQFINWVKKSQGLVLEGEVAAS